MSYKENIQPVFDKIKEIKANPLLPRNWVKLIAKRTGKSETIIRQYVLGAKNVPDGPIEVLEHLKAIISEKEEKIKKLTA
jgi:hypothetical protein